MICNYFIVLHYDAKYVFHMDKDGSSAFSRSVATINTFAKDDDAKFIVQIQDGKLPFTAYDVPEHFQVISIENSSEALVKMLHTMSTENKHLCLTWADNMMQYPPLYEKVYDMHTRYNAHYSFCEGYPIGVSPIYLSKSCIEMLASIIAHKDTIAPNKMYTNTVDRNSLFSILETRINDFDIEAYLSTEDMRELRISLTGDTRNNYIISKKLYENNIINPDEIYSTFFRKPNLFRGVPIYVYFQITNTIFPCAYMPETITDAFPDIPKSSAIDLAVFESCVKKIYEFSPEAVLCLGYNGEVALHSEFPTILKIASSYFNTIYVETTGRNWQSHLTHSCWQEAWMQKVSWIVSIDAYKSETYKKIHNVDMDEVRDFCEFLIANINTHAIYPQATRIPENEQDLESFMKYWNSREVNPIIQKYNDYCKTLPDKKIVDLAPITRFPCFHIARDLVVLLNAQVVRCSQAQNTSHILANLLEQNMEEVWEANLGLYHNHVDKKYPDICNNCDQYYIVNA